MAGSRLAAPKLQAKAGSSPLRYAFGLVPDRGGGYCARTIHR
jgi:hypothetical protein